MVRRLIGFEDDCPGIAGERLLQGHARRHSNAGREAVGHQRPPGAVDDDDRPVPQMGLPLQFDLGPEMSDQHTGDSHNLSPKRLVPRRTGREHDREQLFCCQSDCGSAESLLPPSCRLPAAFLPHTGTGRRSATCRVLVAPRAGRTCYTSLRTSDAIRAGLYAPGGCAIHVWYQVDGESALYGPA